MALFSRHPELLLICLAFLVAYGVHRGLSPSAWHAAWRHAAAAEQRWNDTWSTGSARRRWNDTRQFLDVEATTTTSRSSTLKTEGTTKNVPGTSTTWATTVAGHLAGSTIAQGRSGVWMPTELGHLSARLQSFLEPILHPQGRWVQVAGDWIWKDARMRLWNLCSDLLSIVF